MLHKPLLTIDAGTAEVFGDLAAALTADNRRGHRTRVQDLWLASQAVQHGFELLTRNPSDFVDIPCLDLLLVDLPTASATVAAGDDSAQCSAASGHGVRQSQQIWEARDANPRRCEEVRWRRVVVSMVCNTAHNAAVNM